MHLMQTVVVKEKQRVKNHDTENKKQKTEVNPNISITTLKVNELSNSNKR